jgi:ribosomal protein S18
MAEQRKSEIRYLNAPSIDTKKKKYCRFKKSGIKYIDYKDPEFLKRFLNEQGKILPRRSGSRGETPRPLPYRPPPRPNTPRSHGAASNNRT